MIRARLSDRANAQLETIFDYTDSRWGEDQAERYTRALLAACDRIAAKTIVSRPVPAELDAQGYFVRVASHYIYWRYRADGDVDIIAILHQRMNLWQRIIDLFAQDQPGN